MTVMASISNHAYHFTDTARLPWIIEDGELRPDKNRIGGFPPDLLWATTSEVGDKTSAAFSKAWRMGAVQLIRFTFEGAHFSHWRDIVETDPAWTGDHIAGLERSAAALGEYDASKWRARRAPLPISHAIAVHARSYLDRRWKLIDCTSDYCIAFGPDERGFVIGGQAYCATRDHVGYRDLARFSVERENAQSIQMLTSEGSHPSSRVPDNGGCRLQAGRMY